MPYVFKEVLDDGEVEADVVERGEYAGLNEQLNMAVSERDAAVARADEAEADAARMRDKYAKRFLTTPSQAKQDLEDDVKRDTGARTFAELFAERENQ